MKSLFGRLIPAIFICAFLFITFSLFTIFTNVATLQRTEKTVDHTITIKDTANQLLIDILIAGNEQEYFIITGQQSALNRYNQALVKVNESLTAVTQLTHDDPIQQKNIADLREHLKQREAWQQQLIALREQGPINPDLIPLDANTQNRNQIRTIFTRINAEEDTLFTQHNNQTQIEYRTVYTNAALTFLGNILIIIITFYFLRKEFEERSEVEQAKDDFINLASHELNTPITSLKIFTKVLRSKITNEKLPETKKYLDKIDEQSNKLTMLITDLLDISRIQTGKIRIDKERFNLSSLISETVEGIQGTTHIHTILTKQSYTGDVFADRYRLYQVLVNLLTNAIKYSPKGGDIVVLTKKSNNSVVVSITDKGIGIDKKYQQKIFDRLYQVTDVKEKTFPGLGIGLFISKEIIDMHGGSMWVKSEKGKGSTFSFSIPL